MRLRGHCQQCTEWPGLGPLEVLASVLDLPLERRAALFSWSERHNAVFKVLSGNKEKIEVLAWFNFSIFAGERSWVAGVELAAAGEPPARKPRIWGRRPPGVDPSHPVDCGPKHETGPPLPSPRVDAAVDPS